MTRQHEGARGERGVDNEYGYDTAAARAAEEGSAGERVEGEGIEEGRATSERLRAGAMSSVSPAGVPTARTAGVLLARTAGEGEGEGGGDRGASEGSLKELVRLSSEGAARSHWRAGHHAGPGASESGQILLELRRPPSGEAKGEGRGNEAAGGSLQRPGVIPTAVAAGGEEMIYGPQSDGSLRLPHSFEELCGWLEISDGAAERMAPDARSRQVHMRQASSVGGKASCSHAPARVPSRIAAGMLAGAAVVQRVAPLPASSAVAVVRAVPIVTCVPVRHKVEPSRGHHEVEPRDELIVVRCSAEGMRSVPIAEAWGDMPIAHARPHESAPMSRVMVTPVEHHGAETRAEASLEPHAAAMSMPVAVGVVMSRGMMHQAEHSEAARRAEDRPAGSAAQVAIVAGGHESASGARGREDAQLVASTLGMDCRNRAEYVVEARAGVDSGAHRQSMGGGRERRVRFAESEEETERRTEERRARSAGKARRARFARESMKPPPPMPTARWTTWAGKVTKSNPAEKLISMVQRNWRQKGEGPSMEVRERAKELDIDDMFLMDQGASAGARELMDHASDEVAKSTRGEAAGVKEPTVSGGQGAETAKATARAAEAATQRAAKGNEKLRGRQEEESRDPWSTRRSAAAMQASDELARGQRQEEGRAAAERKTQARRGRQAARAAAEEAARRRRETGWPLTKLWKTDVDEKGGPVQASAVTRQAKTAAGRQRLRPMSEAAVQARGGQGSEPEEAATNTQQSDSQAEDAAGGTQLDVWPGGTQLEDREGGTQLDVWPGGTQLDDRAGGTQADMWPGGTQLDDRAGGTQEDRWPGGTQLDDRAGGTQDDVEVSSSKAKAKAKAKATAMGVEPGAGGEERLRWKELRVGGTAYVHVADGTSRWLEVKINKVDEEARPMQVQVTPCNGEGPTAARIDELAGADGEALWWSTAGVVGPSEFKTARPWVTEDVTARASEEAGAAAQELPKSIATCGDDVELMAVYRALRAAAVRHAGYARSGERELVEWADDIMVVFLELSDGRVLEGESMEDRLYDAEVPWTWLLAQAAKLSRVDLLPMHGRALTMAEAYGVAEAEVLTAAETGVDLRDAWRGGWLRWRGQLSVIDLARWLREVVVDFEKAKERRGRVADEVAGEEKKQGQEAANRRAATHAKDAERNAEINEKLDQAAVKRGERQSGVRAATTTVYRSFFFYNPGGVAVVRRRKGATTSLTTRVGNERLLEDRGASSDDEEEDEEHVAASDGEGEEEDDLGDGRDGQAMPDERLADVLQMAETGPNGKAAFFGLSETQLDGKMLKAVRGELRKAGYRVIASAGVKNKYGKEIAGVLFAYDPDKVSVVGKPTRVVKGRVLHVTIKMLEDDQELDVIVAYMPQSGRPKDMKDSWEPTIALVVKLGEGVLLGGDLNAETYKSLIKVGKDVSKGQTCRPGEIYLYKLMDESLMGEAVLKRLGKETPTSTRVITTAENSETGEAVISDHCIDHIMHSGSLKVRLRARRTLVQSRGGGHAHHGVAGSLLVVSTEQLARLESDKPRLHRMPKAEKSEEGAGSEGGGKEKSEGAKVKVGWPVYYETVEHEAVESVGRHREKGRKARTAAWAVAKAEAAAAGEDGEVAAARVAEAVWQATVATELELGTGVEAAAEALKRVARDCIGTRVVSGRKQLSLCERKRIEMEFWKHQLDEVRELRPTSLNFENLGEMPPRYTYSKKIELPEELKDMYAKETCGSVGAEVRLGARKEAEVKLLRRAYHKAKGEYDEARAERVMDKVTEELMLAEPKEIGYSHAAFAAIKKTRPGAASKKDRVAGGGLVALKVKGSDKLLTGAACDEQVAKEVEENVAKAQMVNLEALGYVMDKLELRRNLEHAPSARAAGKAYQIAERLDAAARQRRAEAQDKLEEEHERQRLGQWAELGTHGVTSKSDVGRVVIDLSRRGATALADVFGGWRRAVVGPRTHRQRCDEGRALPGVRAGADKEEGVAEEKTSEEVEEEMRVEGEQRRRCTRELLESTLDVNVYEMAEREGLHREQVIDRLAKMTRADKLEELEAVVGRIVEHGERVVLKTDEPTEHSHAQAYAEYINQRASARYEEIEREAEKKRLAAEAERREQEEEQQRAADGGGDSSGGGGDGDGGSGGGGAGIEGGEAVGGVAHGAEAALDAASASSPSLASASAATPLPLTPHSPHSPHSPLPPPASGNSSTRWEAFPLTTTGQRDAFPLTQEALLLDPSRPKPTQANPSQPKPPKYYTKT